MNLFDKNQNNFPSYAHRCIWSNGLLLVPPEISLENIEEKQKEIYLDLYLYKASMYADMYEHPEVYLIDAEGIESVLGGRTWLQVHMSARWNQYQDKIKKLEEVERINLPEVICNQFLLYLKRDDNGYYMSYDEYAKRFVRYSLKKCNYKLDESRYLAILSRCGLSVTPAQDRVYFSNAKYPQMFEAVTAWQDLLAPYRKGMDKYKYDSAFSHLDYRFFSPEHMLTYENSKWYMSDDVIAYLDNITNLLSRYGKEFSKVDNTLSIAIGTRFKGKSIEFEHVRTYPTLRVKLFVTDSPAHRKYEERINLLPNADEVKAYCMKWASRCNRCPCRPVPSPSHIGRRKMVFGREMRLCGQFFTIATTDFSEKSLAIMKNVLEMDA